VPAAVSRPVSTAASDTAETRLARIVDAAAIAHRPGLSGFRLLATGDHALDARRAERTLDIQYYLITTDRAGMLFLSSCSSPRCVCSAARPGRRPTG